MTEQEKMVLGVAEWSALNENNGGKYLLVKASGTWVSASGFAFDKIAKELDQFRLSPMVAPEAQEYALAKIKQTQQMTKLDQFAIAALQGSDWSDWELDAANPETNKLIAESVYDLAKAMLDESEKRNK